MTRMKKSTLKKLIKECVKSLLREMDANNPYEPRNNHITVCAWCQQEFGVELPKTDPINNASYSHGMCRRHAEEYMPGIKLTEKGAPDMKEVGPPPGAVIKKKS
jgi:hypothetical protein